MMPDMPLFAFTLLGLMLFAIAAVAFFFFVYDHRAQYYNFGDDHVFTDDHFVCEYTCVGGMENVHTLLRLEYSGGEKALLTYSHKPTNGAKTKRKQKIIQKEAVEAIRSIYKTHCIPVLTDCPKKEEFAMDAPTCSVMFSSDKVSYSISDEQDFPEEIKGVIHEIETTLRSYLS